MSFGTGPWVALFWWIRERVYPRESDGVSKGSLRAELKELGERENWSRPLSPLSSVSEFPPPSLELTQMKGGQTLSHMLIPEPLVHIIGLS